MTEYPASRCVSVDGLSVEWYIGAGKSFDKPRNTSLTKLEKLVKLPQNPVVNPTYIGIVFLTLP